MKRIAPAFLRFALVAGIVLASNLTARAETYTFGIVPQFEARKLARIWAPILNEVERRSGHQIEIIGTSTIPEFEAALIEGKFDFAYMNPYHAIRANEAQDYQPIIRDGARELYGILVVRDDSPYTDVQDIDGQKIAFPAPNALGASLMIRADLTNSHGVDFTPAYVTTHGSAYLNVILKQVAAAGGVMGTFRSQPIEISEQLRVLYKTSRVAPHPIAAHPRVPQEARTAVQNAFLSLWQTGYGREMLEQVPILEAAPASISDYQELKSMGLEKFFHKN
ncbi:phosphate/phosphite/phosphonate ABC transporter substrate-binding protein [Thalassovita sp.]|jgi:phosphonate transport system substrate-binding protein|uniref:phosphate/phosphite/phosphonate ABC transporter substrate-binding protein n=1 Tax=Thalassovita sp. TaxID=1979401 RepID=UPI003B5B7E72